MMNSSGPNKNKGDREGGRQRNTQQPREESEPGSSGNWGKLSRVEYNMEGRSCGEEDGEEITGHAKESRLCQRP